MSSTHRLAAILFTDIVGYTAVMQQDKSKAMEMAQRHEEVVNRTVTRYHGEVVNFYGDGSLSLLETASEALECAREIQLALLDSVPLRIVKTSRSSDHVQVTLSRSITGSVQI